MFTDLLIKNLKFRNDILSIVIKKNFFYVLVIAITATNAKPAKGSTKASLKKKPQCLEQCTDDYKPICAGDGTGKNNKSFGNECVLRNHNCEQSSSKISIYHQ